MKELIKELQNIEDAIRELTKALEAVQTSDAMEPALRIKGAVFTENNVLPQYVHMERRG